MNVDMKITVKSNIDEYRALLKKLSAAAKKVDDILAQINAMELELKFDEGVKGEVSFDEVTE